MTLELIGNSLQQVRAQSCRFYNGCCISLADLRSKVVSGMRMYEFLSCQYHNIAPLDNGIEVTAIDSGYKDIIVGM